jgi:hypothetical protein
VVDLVEARRVGLLALTVNPVWGGIVLLFDLVIVMSALFTTPNCNPANVEAHGSCRRSPTAPPSSPSPTTRASGTSRLWRSGADAEAAQSVAAQPAAGSACRSMNAMSGSGSIGVGVSGPIQWNSSA